MSVLVIRVVVAAPADAAAEAVRAVPVDAAERAAPDAVGSAAVDPERTAASAVAVVAPAVAGDVGAVGVFAVPHERLVVSEAETYTSMNLLLARIEGT